MTFFLAWVVFPLVLALLCLGCGLLLARASNGLLPGPLLLPAGFAVVSVVAQLALVLHATVRLATPAVVVLALAGLVFRRPRGTVRPAGWPAAAAAGVFAVFAAPIVVSGRLTFAGYIKLDDTASYLAMLDRAMQHGYDTAGPASTYTTTLKTILGSGYPLGSLVPLGVGRTLVQQDLAWLWQPYLAVLAALIALALYQLVAGIVRSPPVRAFVAFFAAQAALLYGFALWGGVKELAAALLLATTVGLVRVRSPVPLAVCCAAVVGALSVGGAVWLVAPLAAAALLVRPPLPRVAAFAVAGGVLAIPAWAAAGRWLSYAGAFTGDTQFGNLRGALNPTEIFGIWLGGDFRISPHHQALTGTFVLVAAAAAVAAVVAAWRRGAWEVVVAAATVTVGCLFYVGLGSPWAGSKALASASPIVLALALAGGATAIAGRRRLGAAAVALVLAGGVAWSNAYQYQHVDLAPSGVMRELASVGDRFGGDGPALLVDFQPYGARHFLRTLQAEGVSELRHVIRLRRGGAVATGVTADIDELRLRDVLAYPTIVVRRSPVASRPPSVYRLAWVGRYYEVWRRRGGERRVLAHLPLGSRFVPSAVPRCSDVLRLAQSARRSGGMLAAVVRPPIVLVEADGTVAPPQKLRSYGEPAKATYRTGRYRVRASFTVGAAGDYGVWVGGTFRASVEARIDGRRVGAARNVLDWPNTYLELGRIHLGTGRHAFRLDYAGPDLRPGSNGEPEFGLGPAAIGIGTADRPVRYVAPGNARALCGRRLDWIEVVR